MYKFSDTTPPESGSPPDLGENSASNDYKPDDSVPELDFSGGVGSSGGSAGAASGLSSLLDKSDLGGGSDSNESSGGSSEEVEFTGTPKIVFFSSNLDSYRQLDSDLDLIINDLLLKVENSDDLKFSDVKELLEYFYRRLEDYNWTVDALLKLTFGDRKNLDEFIIKKIKQQKNISEKFDIFSTINKIYSGFSNKDLEELKFMSAVKTKLAIKDGKIVREVVQSEDTSGLSRKDVVSALKSQLATKIVEARRSIKKVKLSVNAAHGLLSKRERLAAEAADDDVEDIDEVEELDTESGEFDFDAEGDFDFSDIGDTEFGDDIKELDNELAEQSEAVGDSADELQEVIKSLTEAVRELNKAVQSLTPAEITKEEDDEISELISEGKEVADEGMEALDDVSELEEDIKASMRRLMVRFSRKKGKGKGRSKSRLNSETKDEAGSSGKKTPKPSDKEFDGDGSSAKDYSGSGKEKERKKSSFFSRLRSAFTGDENVGLGDSSSGGNRGQKSIREIIELATKAIRETGSLKDLNSQLSDSDRKKLFDLVWAGEIEGASPEDLGGDYPYSYASRRGRLRHSAWTNLYEDIDKTSKVKDDGSGNATAEQINRGFQSGNSKFNQDSKKFPTNFGEGYGDLEPPMSGGSKPKLAFSDEQKLKIRKAAEIAFEEQFKHIIDNPISLAITKEFMRKGLSESDAIEAAYNVLAESMEPAVKLAISRALEYLDKDEVALLRRAKDVALYQVVLGTEGSGGNTSSNLDRWKKSSLRNPALRSSGTDGAEDYVDKIFQSMVK
ncbi:MAG: hypothetical protein ABIK31_00340 [candidate division WOR-3 bacterium]